MSRVQGSGCPSFKAVLLFVVIGDTQIEVGPDRIFHATPKYLENLIGGKIGVVNGAERITAGDKAARRQWIIRIRELHMLIAAIELDWPDGVLGEKHNAGVV